MAGSAPEPNDGSARRRPFSSAGPRTPPSHRSFREGRQQVGRRLDPLELDLQVLLLIVPALQRDEQAGVARRVGQPHPHSGGRGPDGAERVNGRGAGAGLLR